MITTDILILGLGPAGATAGIYSARAGAKTVILESFAPGGQINLTHEIENFPGYLSIGGPDLGEKMTTQAEKAGCEIIFDEVKEIDLIKKTVTAFENVIRYKSLIIAGGCKPRTLGIPREDDFIGNGIHFCSLCDGAFYKGKNIVIVGGGNHAVEEAIYMRDIAKSIVIVNDIDNYRAQEVLIKQIASIPVHHNSGVKDLVVNNEKISGVILKDGTHVPVDGMFVAIGRVPNSEPFVGKVEMTKDKYIIVDAHMATSVDGVFACGDIIQKDVRQIITACADGAIAGTYATAYIKGIK